MKSPHQLNMEICKTLGLSKMVASKVTLTLEYDQMPKLEVSTYLVGANGQLVIEADGVGERLAQIQFMLRLEPFSD